MRPIRLLLVPALALLLGGCLFDTGERPRETLAGGGGVETVGIRGEAIYLHGQPVVGARVRLLPKDYVSDSGLTQLPKRGALDRAEAVTDAHGAYSIDSVEPGEYLIEVNDLNSQAAVVAADVPAALAVYRVAEATLQSTATLIGGVAAAGTAVNGAYVQIYGMDRMAKTDAAGAFRIDDLPSGSFNLIIRWPRPYGYTATTTLYDVTLAAGQTLDLGVTEIPSGCQEFKCDSLVVKYVLEANGQGSVPAESVYFTTSGWQRVSELDFTRRGITVIPPEIKDLNQLYRLTLDGNGLESLPLEVTRIGSLGYLSAEGNRLRTVPAELANLKQLTWLHLSDNLIDSLPSAIGGLSALRYLVLDDNNLTRLPSDIGRLSNLNQLYLSNNKIATLPGVLMNMPKLSLITVYNDYLCYMEINLMSWMDAHAGQWRQSQLCPWNGK